ncbi:MAG: glycosyltransferase family 9 protein, partial [Chloroflexota bacterium]
GIMLLEHLGDIVACEPVARYLKREIPDACIVWGVKETYRELFDANPSVDMVLSLHCLTERLLLKRTGFFDQFIDLHLSGRHCSLCRKPLMRDDNSSVNLKNYFSHGGILTAFSLAAGLPPLDEAPRVYIPEVVTRQVDGLGLPGRFVAVNCTSNSAKKNWPVDKWLALMKAMPGLPFVEVGLQSRLSGCMNLCGHLSILETAEVIRRAELFIGIDSGPSHLANAVRTPGVILMGRHLGFDAYQPFSGAYRNGERVEIIQAGDLVDTISVETVVQAARRLLS